MHGFLWTLSHMHLLLIMVIVHNCGNNCILGLVILVDSLNLEMVCRILNLYCLVTVNHF